MLQAVKVPDVVPSSLPLGSDFSLVAGMPQLSGWNIFLTTEESVGDFEEIYGAEEDGNGQEPHSGQWDAIMTCFFIDTVSNASTVESNPLIPAIIGKEYCQLPPYYSQNTSSWWCLDQSW